nr:MAG TPA: hypothetical protein [Caudoviricetes sp.]
MKQIQNKIEGIVRLSPRSFIINNLIISMSIDIYSERSKYDYYNGY